MLLMQPNSKSDLDRGINFEPFVMLTEIRMADCIGLTHGSSSEEKG